jgi:hypothetical protein
MTTYEARVEVVCLRREIDRDEGKGIQRDGVYGNKPVPPFTTNCQRGRGIAVELISLVEGVMLQMKLVHRSPKT